MYLHERENWWQFTYDSSKVLKLLGRIQGEQGMVLGSLSTLGFEFQDEAMRFYHVCRTGSFFREN
mgnify:CR=1 FL=1